MKKIISVFTMLTLVFIMICSLTACGGKTKKSFEVSSGEPLAVSFVLGMGHSNFPGLGTNAQRIYSKLLDVCTNYGNVSYAVVEGTPEQTDSVPIEKSEKHISETKRREIAKRNANSIFNSFSSLRAKTPEVDTLQTIRLSANILASSGYETKEMVIYDSGLCTTGLLSQLSSNVLATDPEIVVDKLEALHALPELNGVDVTWVGLGCVSGEQQRIPDSYMYALKTLWTLIVERSGGQITFDTTPVTGEEIEGLPHVSVVEFPSDDLGLGEVVDAGTLIIAFKEDTVKFIGDRADFVDPSAATAALNPVADFLKDNPERKIIIAGTTAKVGTGDGIELSNARAQAVKQVLISSGVQESQMECVGLGCTDNCLRVEDHNSDGSLNEEMAAQNRAIYIVLSDSTTAMSLRGEQT